jgi:FkbM family methyltransferase
VRRGNTLIRLRDRASSLAQGASPAAGLDVVSVDTDVGPLFAHAADEGLTPSLRLTRQWEPAESAWLRRTIRPGDLVIDCGANIGYLTLLASTATGPTGTVLAVEPEPANVALLRFNLWRNACDNVAVAQVAAGSRRDVLALRLNPSNLGDHQLHPEPAAGDLLVPTIALDDLLADMRVDVAKIDTQGVDHDVVAGLARTIARNPGLRLLVEFWLEGMASRNVDPAAVLAGYRALNRPLELLTNDGTAAAATDAEILDAAVGWEGGYVNLVIGRR